MTSRRSGQQSLLAADTQQLDFVGAERFCRLLVRHGRELLRDEEFADRYCPDLAHPRVPRSVAANGD